MCGISGIFDQSRRVSMAPLIEKMASALHHRGPDYQQCWQSNVENLALGHARLSIHDLSSAGHQPMLSYSGDWVTVFNGEIYNYPELRQLLLKDEVPFFGDADTEVLVNALDHWGVEAT